MQTRKYAFRNSPPYSANQCKSMKKRGNDGTMYVSQADKNGTYKWVPVTKTLKNRAARAARAASGDLQKLAKKYMVSPSGSTKELAHRLVELRGASVTNKKDKHIIEQFLTHSTPSTKRWGFVPA
jgi:hypothetical protein